MTDPAKLDWADIEIFCHLSEFGSIRAAARKTGLSVETIRRRISNLELRLGKRLFRRSPSGLVITKHGETVLTHALKAREAIKNIADATGSSRSRRPQVFTVALPEEISFSWRPSSNFFKTLRKKNVGLNFVHSVHVNQHQSKDPDIVISTSRPDNPEMLCRRIGSISFSLHVSLKLAQEQNIDLCDLLLNDFSICEWSGHAEIELMQAIAGNSKSESDKLILIAASFSQILSIVSSNRVIGLLPRLSHVYEAHDLITVGPVVSTREVWATYHKDLVSEQSGRLLVSSICAELSDVYSQNKQSVNEQRTSASIALAQ